MERGLPWTNPLLTVGIELCGTHSGFLWSYCRYIQFSFLSFACPASMFLWITVTLRCFLFDLRLTLALAIRWFALKLSFGLNRLYSHPPGCWFNHMPVGKIQLRCALWSVFLHAFSSFSALKDYYLHCGYSWTFRFCGLVASVNVVKFKCIPHFLILFGYGPCSVLRYI